MKNKINNLIKLLLWKGKIYLKQYLILYKNKIDFINEYMNKRKKERIINSKGKNYVFSFVKNIIKIVNIYYLIINCVLFSLSYKHVCQTNENRAKFFNKCFNWEFL